MKENEGNEMDMNEKEKGHDAKSKEMNGSERTIVGR